MRSRQILLAALFAILAAQIAWQFSLGQSPKPRAEHVPAEELRRRMLMEFHGRSTDVFADAPGFGMSRMIPVYRRIPWEMPHFSTDDIEVENVPGASEALKSIFAKSIAEFEKTEAGRKQNKPATPSAKPERLEEVRIVGENQAITSALQLRLLDLIGLSDPARPKVFAGGQAFELVRVNRNHALKELADAKTGAAAPKKPGEPADDPALESRPLDQFETAGLIELAAGKETFVRTKGNTTRMLGALRIRDKCLECHTQSRPGDLMGAFSYAFVDIERQRRK